MSPSLKEAAHAAFVARRERILHAQRGIMTFFDNYFEKIIKNLVAAKDVHGWDPESPAAAAPKNARMFTDLRWLSRQLANARHGRFVPYAVRRADERNMPVTEIGPLETLMSQGAKDCLAWKGKPLFKTVFDFALLPMLLWDLKPATIFEIGSGTGASAEWLADTAREQGLSVQVYSADITPPALSYPKVQFFAGDCNDPATLFPAALLAAAAKPWLIIEDAHVNVHSVLAHFDRLLAPGDYFVVEDSAAKVQDLETFMDVRGDRYAVDTRYTDFFGRNATSAPNSIFRKMPDAPR
jgi:cephalosporin hydroxylase